MRQYKTPLTLLVFRATSAAEIELKEDSMRIIRLSMLLIGFMAVAISAKCQSADWDTQVGRSGGTVSVTIAPSPSHYRITAVTQNGGATTQWAPIDGSGVSTSFNVTGGRLHISVRSVNGSGQPQIPIHIADCPNNTKHFSMSQQASGNPCANWTEATVTVRAN
jgi:hypothetical protein